MAAIEDGASTSVIDVLVSIYASLRQAWRGALLEQDCASEAPWQQWRDVPEDTPITAADLLMQYGEESGALAAQAVTQHLGLLARAYWLEPTNPDGPDYLRWLHAAPFGPARAVLEGTAMTGWLLAPTPSPADRVLRGAMLALWSHPKSWENDVKAAGLNVERNDNDVPFVRINEGSRPLSMSTMIKEVHGKKAVSAYSRWSKLLHNDPRETAQRTLYRLEAAGRVGRGELREDEHLLLASAMARALTQAGQNQAAYFGRTAAALVDECEAVIATVDEQLPSVIAAIRDRNQHQGQ